jgi:hypothetical protein
VSFHISWVGQFDIDQLDLVLDVFKILVPESLVSEHELGACLLKDLLAESIEVIIVELAAQDVLIDFLAKFHDFLEVFRCDIILLRVDLRLHEHLVVLLPESLEIGVLLNDEINDVQSGENLPEVVEDFMVDHLLERVGVNLVFTIKQAVHLVNDVLGEIYDSSDHIEELVENFESSTDLEFEVPRLISLLVFEDKS